MGDSKDDSLLESIGGASATPAPADQAPGAPQESEDQVTSEHPARYELREEKGRGGIGRVLLAFDAHIGREIAVKELLGKHTSGDSQASGRSTGFAERFLREARVTGQLEHPSIVPVYELGRRGDGTLYYTMKLVRGRTLADALRECDDVQERLGLLGHFANVCQAMGYAHSRGVIHRDIKPDNIMVGEFGETVVLDWGLAKASDQSDIMRNKLLEELPHANPDASDSQSAHQTLDGHAIGTPAYMSPEQAEGDIDAIDQRSDVWSLGAVLYEILTGTPPYDGDTAYEIIGKVMREEVAPVAQRADDAPPELAAVAERALARDKDDRYLDAREVAEEIEAFRSGRRVEAHAYTTWQLVRRILDQNRTAVAVACIALLVLAGLMTFAYQQILEERDTALAHEQESEVRLGQALGEKSKSAFQHNDWMLADVYAAAALERFDDPGVRGLFMELSDTWRPTLQWDQRLGTKCPDVAFSIKHNAVACPTHMAVIVWDLETGEQLHRLASLGGWMRTADTNPTQLLAAGKDTKLYRWKLSNWKPLPAVESGHKKSITIARFTTEGSGLIVGSADGAVSQWAVSDHGLQRQRFVQERGAPITDLALSPDGTTLAVADDRGRVAYFDIESGKKAWEFQGHSGEAIHSVAFSPDGGTIATGGEDHILTLWKNNGEKLFDIEAHDGEVRSVSFAAGGRVLVSASDDGTIRAWRPNDGTALSRFRPHDGEVTRILIGQGNMITASANKSVRAWTTRVQRNPRVLGGTPDHPSAVAFSPDGSLVVAVSEAEGESGRVWDRATGIPRAILRSDADDTAALSYHATNNVLATGGEDKTVRLWDLSPLADPQWRGELKETFQLQSTEAVRALAFSPDGELLAVSGDDRKIRFWDLEGEGDSFNRKGHKAPVTCLAFEPQKGYLASGSWDGTVRIWWGDPNQKPLILAGHEGNVNSVAFIPGSDRIASVGNDGFLHIWDTDSSMAVRKVKGHDGKLWAVAASPDGRVLASGGEDGHVMLWDPESGSQLAFFDIPGSEIAGLAFSPDGTTLAAAASDDDIHLWTLDRLFTPREGLLDTALIRYGMMLDGITALPDPEWSKEEAHVR